MEVPFRGEMEEIPNGVSFDEWSSNGGGLRFHFRKGQQIVSVELPNYENAEISVETIWLSKKETA